MKTSLKLCRTQFRLLPRGGSEDNIQLETSPGEEAQAGRCPLVPFKSLVNTQQQASGSWLPTGIFLSNCIVSNLYGNIMTNQIIRYQYFLKIFALNPTVRCSIFHRTPRHPYNQPSPSSITVSYVHPSLTCFPLFFAPLLEVPSQR